MEPRDQSPAPSSRALALAAAAVAVLAVLGAAAGIPGRATYGAQVSGDEPHYLLTALSLAEDGGLDIADELAAERHRPFHAAELQRQAAPRPGGGRVVPHDPLLPALLALPMWLGGWVGAKLALAGIAAALAALVVWVAVRRLSVPVGPAAGVTAVFAASAPLAAYGHQVYPELPAALATTAAVAALTGPLRRGGRAVLAVTVVALPWLAVKYVPVAAALAAIGLVRLWRRNDPTMGARLAGRGSAVVFAGVLTAAAAVYVGAHLAWYGGLTVYASGDFFQAHGGQLSVVGTEPDYLGRSRRLLGLLIGRDFGIAAWQPAWLLAVPAAAALVRRRPAGWVALAAPFAAAWLTATFVAVTMQGWWFPGRQVVIVLPLAIIAIAWWVGALLRPAASRPRPRLPAGLGLLALSGALGVWSYAWLAAGAAGGDVTWIVDFVETADPWYRLWRMALPDYLDVSSLTWTLHGAWLLVLAVAAAVGWRSGASATLGSGRRP